MIFLTAKGFLDRTFCFLPSVCALNFHPSYNKVYSSFHSFLCLVPAPSFLISFTGLFFVAFHTLHLCLPLLACAVSFCCYSGFISYLFIENNSPEPSSFRALIKVMFTCLDLRLFHFFMYFVFQISPPPPSCASPQVCPRCCCPSWSPWGSRSPWTRWSPSRPTCGPTQHQQQP